jgi:hypothetical protein
MPSLTKEIPKTSPAHARLRMMIEERLKFAVKAQMTKHNAWRKAENNVLAYVPESDLDANRRVARENRGEPKYTTIILPYSYAQLMSAHTYLTSVFFARSPVHQFVARHGETEQQVQMLEACMGYQTEVGKMLGPYYVWFYDALKYGVGIVEEYWDREEIQFSQIQVMPDEMGIPRKMQMQIRAPGYEGSRICNVSPWNFFPDPRVAVGQYQKGEFVFVRKLLSWETIVRRKAQGYYMNIEALGGSIKDFSSSFAQGNDNTSNSQLELPEQNVSISTIDETKHPAIVPAYEACISIIPREWGFGESDFPEKWMFTITGDLSTIIGAQPHGAMHGQFPYGVIETEIEGYGVWNRGLPEILEPIQNTLDWLINQHFYNVRAAMNNQFIIDPSKVVTKDASAAGPGFLWRLRPEAYGQDIRTFVHQIPVQDMTRGHVTDMNTMFGIAERVTGVNDQIMGAINSGGRKTATEVRTTTGFGVNRLKTLTEYISMTGFSEHAQRLVQMTQQYMSAEKKFRIVGTLAQDAGPGATQQFMSVDQQAIQGFYDFVPVDGTLPVDRLALANLWKDILLQMRAVPGLIMQFDLSRVFSHVASLAGIRNLNQFRLQMGSPAALAQMAEAGNVVPLRGGEPSAGVPTSGYGGGAPGGEGVA